MGKRIATIVVVLSLLVLSMALLIPREEPVLLPEPTLCEGKIPTPKTTPSEAVDPATPGLKRPYPLIVDKISRYDDSELDEQGIILARYGEELHYNPTTIGFYALTHYRDYYQTGSEESLEKFLSHAEWLRENFEPREDFGVWNYHFPFPEWRAVPPWISALSQGLGISVMLQAWDVTGEEEYREIARRAVNSFAVLVENGGVKSARPDGTVWYEEYPSIENSHVLNGFIFALAGLRDYYLATNDPQAKELFESGVDSLRRRITEYDVGYTSLYDKYYRSNTVAGGYHTLHIRQMLWLFHATGDELFFTHAREWLNYDTGFIQRVTADSSIDPDNHGPTNLYDGTKYYGLWSSNRLPVTLILDAKEPLSDIDAVVFFGTSRETSPRSFTVSVSNDRRNWTEILDVDGATPEAVGSNQTGSHFTAIRKYGTNRANARYIRITVNSVHVGNVVGLREIDVHFDQSDNINEMYEMMLESFEPVRR